MKAAPFRYHAPRSVAEAVDLLAGKDNARLLAGGQSLMAMLNLRVAAFDDVIDLGRIPELVGVEEMDETISIGAMTTQRAVERSELVRRFCPLLAEAVGHVGHQQTRNRGTIGGSLAHLDPGAELPVAAAALDAQLTIVGRNGTRSLPFADFPAGYLANTMEPDELLARIDAPKCRVREGSAFFEFNRRPADFAIASVAARLQLSEQGLFERAALAVGGVRGEPTRLADIERALIGKEPSHSTIASAARAIGAFECDGDDLYPPDFRQEICGVLLERALLRAVERARGRHG